jgi:hypothetical protein
MPTRSTAPIALLIAAGLFCLGATAVIVPTTETTTAPTAVRVDEPVVNVTTTVTDPVLLTLSVGFLALAVLSFGAAALLVVRRVRAARQRP